MKGFTTLVLGIFATLAFSWMGLAFIPNLQIGHLEPQTDEEGKDAYPAPKSGMAERGHRVYVANGCFYCHSQQVRADYAGSDIERKWGERRSAPRDYIFDRPAELGRMRMGPDLANIGHRAPPEDQNAPPGGSPAPSAGASPANASSAPAPSNPQANAAAAPNASPAAAAGQASASPSPGASPASAVGKPQPSAGATTPAAPQPSASPAQNVAAGAKPSPAPSAPASPANVAAASAAVAGASPALQQALSPGAGAATSLEVSPSGSPAPYSAGWHHVHLYSPRSVNIDSDMPAYKFLYIKRRIGGQRSAEALKLRGEDAPGNGWEVIPSFDAECLVAYLMSLDQSHPLREVKAAPAPPSSPSPGKSPP